MTSSAAAADVPDGCAEQGFSLRFFRSLQKVGSRTYQRLDSLDAEASAPVSQVDQPASSQSQQSTPFTEAVKSATRAFWDSGTACVATAAVVFSLSSLCVKLTGGRVPVLQIVATRSSLSWAATLLLAHLSNTRPLFGSRANRTTLALRGAVGAAAMTTYYQSIQRLPLADAVTIFFFNPAITAIAARLFLSEPLGLLGALGCSTSIGGVVILTHPPFLFGHNEHFTRRRIAGIVYGCISAVFAAAAFVVIRKLGKSEAASVLALWFHSAAFVSSFFPLLVGVPQPAVLPQLGDCGLLLGVAATSFVGQILLNRGFQVQVASRASAINFTQVLYSYVWGLLLLHDRLTWGGALGSVLIAAGVLAVNARRAEVAGAKGGQQAEPQENLEAKGGLLQMSVGGGKGGRLVEVAARCGRTDVEGPGVGVKGGRGVSSDDGSGAFLRCGVENEGEGEGSLQDGGQAGRWGEVSSQASVRPGAT